MAILNKNIRSMRKTSYNLVYHLNKTGNMRLKGKIRALVKLIPEKFNAKVKFTKRRIWFLGSSGKFMQVVVGKNKLYVKIKTSGKWEGLNLPDWEDFKRVHYILNDRK